MGFALSDYVIDIFNESAGFILPVIDTLVRFPGLSTQPSVLQICRNIYDIAGPHQASRMTACLKYLLDLGQSDGDREYLQNSQTSPRKQRYHVQDNIVS